jgi:hypothetical protein
MQNDNARLLRDDSRTYGRRGNGGRRGGEGGEG